MLVWKRFFTFSFFPFFAFNIYDFIFIIYHCSIVNTSFTLKFCSTWKITWRMLFKHMHYLKFEKIAINNMKFIYPNKLSREF